MTLKKQAVLLSSLKVVFFLWARLFSPAVKHVPNSKNRVVPGHPGSGIAHNFTDFLSQLRLIAVDGTVAAGSLIFLKRTILQSYPCIFNQFLANSP